MPIKGESEGRLFLEARTVCELPKALHEGRLEDIPEQGCDKCGWKRERAPGLVRRFTQAIIPI